MDKGKKHLILIFGTFQIKPSLTWHIFKVWDNPYSIFQRWPPIKIKTIHIPISFINFSKFHQVVFFKSKFRAKSSLFPFIFHSKKAILDTYFEIAPVSLQSRWGMVLSHKYTRNTMNITNAKKFKNSPSRFFKQQPSRTSLCNVNIFE